LHIELRLLDMKEGGTVGPVVSVTANGSATLTNLTVLVLDFAGLADVQVS